MWRNIGRTMGEYSKLDELWRGERVRIVGGSALTAARETKRPRIMLIVHLGNWELPGAILDPDSLHVIQLPANLAERRILTWARATYRERLVESGPAGARAALRALQRDVPVYLAADAFVSGEVESPRFGRPPLASGNLNYAVRLARMTGAVILPLFVRRLAGTNFEIVLLPHHDPTGPIESEVAALDAMVTPIVLEHLDQWFMLHALTLPSASA
jgi:Kdo2-lipid IVA lauroyltransferase/acyltransferase